MSSDDEFEDPRPKKRRKSRFDEKEAGQSTLTQFDRDFSTRKAPRQEYELDEDGFQIWQDSDVEQAAVEAAERRSSGRRTLPWLRDPIENEQNREPEIPETSQLDVVPITQAPGENTVPGAAVSTKLQTPRKVRFQEVPSSQTPPSTVESLEMVVKNPALSPLKEKSANLQPTHGLVHRSPESQNISIKMLERVRFQTKKIPLNDVTKLNLSRKGDQAVHENPDALPMPKSATPTRLLTKTSTIADSQSEDASLSRVSSLESTITQQQISTEPLAQRQRTLQRVSTVQDSQFDDEDFLPESNGTADPGPEDLQLIEESQFPMEDTQHGYFDPANSALDRDALRFRWTQTQHQLSNINEEDSDAETDDGDLDRAFGDHAAARNSIPSLEAPDREAAKPSPLTVQEVNATNPPPSATKPSALPRIQRPDSRDDRAYESADHANHEEVLVLSSSPPPRPSQVSTVVPTQASVQELSARKEGATLVTQRAEMFELSVDPISPHKPFRPPESLSSSPFPLPPWSSPQKARSTEQLRDEDGSPLRSSQLAVLVDYSLPPPPTLSSSGRQTPMSSLR